MRLKHKDIIAGECSLFSNVSIILFEESIGSRRRAKVDIASAREVWAT